jgi:hypothetical protein
MPRLLLASTLLRLRRLRAEFGEDQYDALVRTAKLERAARLILVVLGFVSALLVGFALAPAFEPLF